MNVEKLAKHLKEFTLDEIEMIAECDCKTELERLLNGGKLVFEQEKYKYIEKEAIKTFELIKKPEINYCGKILFKDIALLYLNDRKLTKDTLKGYKSQLKFNILPAFGEKYLDDITYEMIVEFMEFLKSRYKPKTASNGVTLLGSILKYAYLQGYTKNNPYYGVKNSMCK